MVDAVIAGAGIAGIATAWRLAERLGTTDAVLVDPRPPLSVTSNRPEANYRDWWPQPAMAELADRSLGLVDQLLADGAAIPIDRRGYLYVTRDPSRAATLARTVDERARAGTSAVGAEVLHSAAIRRRWPHLAPDIVGGVLVHRAGGIDTVALGRAMLERARARGVSIMRAEVIGIDLDRDGVGSVRVLSDDGPRRIETRRFVNAAGPFAQPLLDLVGAALPIETVLRQKVVVRDSHGIVPRTAPFTITLDRQRIDWTEAERERLDQTAEGRLLLQELPGGLHSKPDDTAGPDALKLGWAWDQRPSPPIIAPACPPEFPDMVLRGAQSWIPGLEAASDGAIEAHEGGFYARVADGQPVIGPIGPEGSFVVGAMAGFGAMMAAGAGDLAAAWIAGDAPSAPMRAFQPARFEDPAYRLEFESGRVATGEL